MRARRLGKPSSELREPAAVGQLLREKRKAAGISLGEMARRLQYAKSSLSAAETGGIHPSQRLLKGYERVLQLPPGSLATPYNPIAGLMEAAHHSHPYIPAPTADTSQQDRLPTHPDVIEGVRDCLQRAITLIAAAACTAEKRDDDEILIAFSASHEGFHIEPGLCERWLATLCRVLQAGYRVVHIVRPGESTRQHVELIKELRQLLNPAWHYEPYYIPASDTTFMVPCDLVIVPHQGALQLFSTYHSQHVDSAFFFPHGSQHFDILRRYFTLIQANADPLLQTYAASSNAFAEAILAAEQHDGEEILLLNNVSFKRMPGYVHTERVRRILASYAELPDHKRALEVRLQRALKINERRRRRFEDRLREHPVYHICSKATIERMVKVGDYTDDWIAEFGPSAQLTAAEAAACVRQQIHDLQTFPQYELALVSEESAGEMTAHYWEVIGDHSALFAARLPRDDLAPVETSNTLYLATQVPAVVQALRNFCFQTWDELPAADKDKERVIAWLRALIS